MSLSASNIHKYTQSSITCSKYSETNKVKGTRMRWYEVIEKRLSTNSMIAFRRRKSRG